MLTDSIKVLTGIGEQKEKELAALDIQSIADLLFHFPHRYINYTLSDPATAEDGSKITVQGEICSEPTLKWFRGNKSRLLITIRVHESIINATWFNQPYLKDKLIIGKQIAIFGRFEVQQRTLVVERTFISAKEQEALSGTNEPVYPTAGKIKSYMLRKYIQEALPKYSEHIDEILPAQILTKYRLIARQTAIRALHSPSSSEQLHQARRRMIYEELFLYQVQLLFCKRQQDAQLIGRAHLFDRTLFDQFMSELPLTPTDAQSRVIKEILNDLASERPMNRLLQGDVGSGKTLVIAAILYANLLAGDQGAVMVPTEILAEQHFKTLNNFLAKYNVVIRLLTGNMPKATKKENLSQIASGEVDVIVGTHALIQEQVTYDRLGLVITDEQHRFGVKQRLKLSEKGGDTYPDVLTITATPIPRTLALTLAGDLNISTIDELPKNRQPISTHWISKNSWMRIIKFIDQTCTAGQQVYVICPLVKESEKLDLQNTEQLFAELKHDLSSRRIGLLHGQLSAEDKERVMRSFLQHELDILVSTTVIEVGVDVPNATAIVIYDADRFGLSQLHQLRGRVGRGEQASTCILVANPKTEEGRTRLAAMTETTNGFEIAQKDLELRGPGDFLGSRQSGLPLFKLAELERDMKILHCAHHDAASLLAEEDALVNPLYSKLWDTIDTERLLTKQYL